MASIAFGLPHAVVDGNVLRVVARMENDSADIAAPRTRERFRAIVRRWMGPPGAGSFQSGRDGIGRHGLPAGESPVRGLPDCPRLPRVTSRHRRATAGETAQNGAGGDCRGAAPGAPRRSNVLLRQKEAAARRMAGFWELPAPAELSGARPGKTWGAFRHTITHHHYTFTVRSATVRVPGPDFRWFSAEELVPSVCCGFSNIHQYPQVVNPEFQLTFAASRHLKPFRPRLTCCFQKTSRMFDFGKGYC
jgi:A/G-specific adenine glycosylase